jgi:vitamin B12 transporter
MPAYSQTSDERTLDTVLVSGLRAVPADVLTEDVAILDEQRLDIRNTPYVADQLRGVPGVAVSRSGNAGGLTQIRLRGAEANHTLVLLDGIEFSDPVTGETDFGLLSAVGIDRIEVLRGEQSVLYGSDAIGGVIAIYTGEEDALRGSIEAGSRDTFRGELGGGWQDGRSSIQAAISGFSSEGHDVSGRGGEKDASRNGAFLLKGETLIGDDWTLSGLASYRDTYVETDHDLNFDGQLDNADRTTDGEQWLWGAALNGATGPVDHIFRANYNEVTRINEADGSFTDETEGKRTKLSWSPSISFGETFDQSVSLIADYEREDYERVSTNLAFGNPNQSRSFETTGIGGEYRVAVGAFDANASLRQDFNDGEFDDATSWRVGAGYSFESGTRVRASAGRGVKNPTFTELYGFYPGQFIGNADLEPETSTSWEVGIDQTFDRGSVSLTWFEAELEDEIYTAFTPTFASTPENRVGGSDRSGVEAGFQFNPMEGLSFFGQATAFSSENETGEDEIRVPDWTGSLAVDWRPQKDGARFGAALDFVGEQDDFNFGVFPQERVTLDSYVLLSATAEWPLTERISLTLRGENLLDEEATDVFGYANPGAAGFIGLKLR